jgi:hypothetical protein
MWDVLDAKSSVHKSEIVDFEFSGSPRNFVAVDPECAYIASTGLRQTPR